MLAIKVSQSKKIKYGRNSYVLCKILPPSTSHHAEQDNPRSHRMLLDHGQQLFFLRIIHSKAAKPDVGSYYCNATNAHGTALSHNATLHIAGTYRGALVCMFVCPSQHFVSLTLYMACWTDGWLTGLLAGSLA